MRQRTFTTFLVSVAVHALVVSLLVGVAGFSWYPIKTLVADFTLVDGGRGEGAGPGKEGPAARPSPAAKGRGFGTDAMPSQAEPAAAEPTAPAKAAADVQMQTSAPAGVASGARWMSESTGYETGEGQRGGGVSGARGPGGTGDGTGPGGTGGGPSGVRDDLLMGQIREAVMRNISYPERARRMGWEGQVVISFTIMEDGSLGNISIKKSSGVALLDEATESGIRRSTVRLAHAGRLSVVLPVEFRLR